jgi:ATP-dependent DNA helicase RecQ
MSNTPEAILKEYWGYNQFRPLQLDIIQSVMAGKDTLALLPTGGGKSICFQVPALAMNGLCVVVSPLVALMKDQVENLVRRGIQAYYIHAAMGWRQMEITLDNCRFGKAKFLYLSPERLKTNAFRDRFVGMDISFMAIDEAHCISEWGYDFRPPYLQIAELRELKPGIPFLALTASATQQVQDDIKSRLQFGKDAPTFRQTFDRPNIVYSISRNHDKYAVLLRALEKVKGSAIVYVRNRKLTRSLSQWIESQGISATYYHAGLDHAQRSQRQDDWIKGKCRVVVATNAFGMGIDKPDVRLVIHFALPDSLEAYYQEAGRAGRDGRRAHALALVAQSDLDALIQSVDKQFPPIKDVQRTYDALCNFLQIAMGQGDACSYDFDLSSYCQVFKAKPLVVLSHLHMLEQAGYLTLNEAVERNASAHIIPNHSEIIQFKNGNPRYEPVITSMLRLHGGLLDDYVQIYEDKIAKSLSIKRDEVVNLLVALHKLQIVDYQPPSGSPKVTLAHPRVSSEHLMFDHAFIRARKTAITKKVQAVVDYGARNACRGNAILSYFDENQSNSCGHCDWCIGPVKTQKEMRLQLLAFFKGPARSLDEIKRHFDTSNESFRKEFKMMIAEGLLVMAGDQVRQGGNQKDTSIE